jgi:hypothetical protein
MPPRAVRFLGILLMATGLAGGATGCSGDEGPPADASQPIIAPGDRRGDDVDPGLRDKGVSGPYFEVAANNDVETVTAGAAALVTGGDAPQFVVEGTTTDGARVRVLFPPDVPELASCDADAHIALEWIVPAPPAETAPGQAPDPTGRTVV